MGEESNRKKLAELYFDTNKAEQGLIRIDQLLKGISGNSETYADKIKKSFEGINIGTMINTEGYNQKLQTITGYTTKFGNQMKYTLSGKVNLSKLIDINKFKKDFENLTSIGVNGAKKITITTLNENAKVAANRQKNLDKINAAEKIANAKTLTSENLTADKIKVINADVAAYKEKRAADAALAQERYNLKVANSTKTIYDKIANYAQTYLIYQGFSELRQAAKELIDEMVDVEYQMVQIDRVLGDNSLNINDYRDRLIQLAYDYGNSFNNVADVTLRLAQAGFDAEESIALTEKTLLALNTAELNATQATSDMVAVMAQWGLNTGDAAKQAEEYGKIIDYINITADKFPTTSEDLMNALKKTSSAFNLAGASIEETIALITTAEIASQRGGKAIGTAMNNIITQLKDDKRLNIMEAMGIEVFEDEAKTEFKSIIDIITQLSEKMQELKAAGKESSTEMQELLSVFTVFRRNIGSGLLSGVAGEDSTYNQIMGNLTGAAGYSLAENAKHMNTAKAALEQFNATLLELKTTVWDGGAEDMFKGMLLLGNNLIEGFNGVLETFGVLPTAIGAATLAFGLFNKKMKVAKVDASGTKIEWVGLVKVLKDMTTHLKTNGFKMSELTISTAKAEIATIGLKTATMLLNAAWSMGLSFILTSVIGLIDDFVHREENARKALEEETRIISDNISMYEEKGKSINSLISSYEVLLEKQKELNKAFTEEDAIEGSLGIKDIVNVAKIRGGLKEAGIEQGLGTLTDKKTVQEQIDLLVIWEEKLLEAKAQGKDVSEAYEFVNKTLADLNETNNNVLETQEKLNQLYKDKAVEDYLNTLVSGKNIDTLDEYRELIQQIYSSNFLPKEWKDDVPGFKAALEALAEETFPEIVEQLQVFNDMSNEALDDYKKQISYIENLSNNYKSLHEAMQSYNKSGEISIDNFNALVDNGLLQYLELVNGKLKINEAEFNASAESAKQKAIADLQEQAAARILSVVMSDLNVELEGSKEAGIEAASGAKTAAQAALDAAKAAIIGATSFDSFNKAMKGDEIDFSKVSDRAKKEIDSIIADVNRQTTALNAVSLSAAKASSRASGGATKTFKEQSEERVRIFKEEIDDLEALEKAWVNKYKKLELFSTSDLKYITHQRINRYNDYLNQINGLTGISEEDRTALIREYSSKRQELELEYFDLLKDQLDEQIDALEKANDEKIKSIEAAADAEIEALRKVEKENDRIREKEEYEANRNKLLYGDQGIEYWKQRTGREAQLALKEAQEELTELDKEWAEKKEEWTLEEQIEEIENARDAQIKAIEEAQERQIQGWKDAYQKQVELYAQTGQIIYDSSIISAQYLYQAYMDNFVQPFHAQIQNVVNSINTASAAADQVINKMSQIGGGGGGGSSPRITTTPSSLLTIANNNPINYSASTLPTVVANRNQANSNSVFTRTSFFENITNTVKSWFKNIGKYHGGGKVATQAPEALAFVRPNEVVLKPEWAAGLDKLINMANNGNNIANTHNLINNTINIDAELKDKLDMDYLAKRIKKVLKEEFNIKK